MNTQVSIGQVKRDISELVNRVTYSGDRIVLTSRGKPKAALVSMQDYELLLKSEGRTADIKKWLAETQKFSQRIKKRRGKLIDVDAVLDASRNELDER